MQLLDEGKIAYRRVGTHRRVRFEALMKYKAASRRRPPRGARRVGRVRPRTRNLRAVSGFAAFHDASVLYPSELRNLLMHLALTGLFRAKWSAAVHEEWICALLRHRPDLSQRKT